MSNQESIVFINEKVKFALSRKLLLRKWIEKAILDHKKEIGNICFVFCNDNYLLDLNRKHLKHDYFTDIITFDNSEKKSGRAISGDVFISVNRVKENARVLGITFDNELRRVMIHGVLHLLGYNDKSATQIKVMRKLENRYIKRLTAIRQ